MGFVFFSNTFIIEFFLRWFKYCTSVFMKWIYYSKPKDLVMSKFFLDVIRLVCAHLSLVITSSSALESDHRLIEFWAMVWNWVYTMVWRWSDENAIGLKSLIRDPLCLESLIRDILGLENLITDNFCLESLIRDNFGLESLIRQKIGFGPQPGSYLFYESSQ